MKDVTDWLLSEENPPVRYLTLTRLLDRSPRKMIAPVERKGKPNRWITLHALMVLRYFRGWTFP